jgi:hypothetical protein
MAISTNPHRKQEVAMKYPAIKTVALFAALVVSAAANARAPADPLLQLQRQGRTRPFHRS